MMLHHLDTMQWITLLYGYGNILNPIYHYLLALPPRNTWTELLLPLAWSRARAWPSRLETFPLLHFGFTAWIYGVRASRKIKGGGCSTSHGCDFAFILWISRIIRDFAGSVWRSTALCILPPQLGVYPTSLRRFSSVAFFQHATSPWRYRSEDVSLQTNLVRFLFVKIFSILSMIFLRNKQSNRLSLLHGRLWCSATVALSAVCSSLRQYSAERLQVHMLASPCTADIHLFTFTVCLSSEGFISVFNRKPQPYFFTVGADGGNRIISSGSIHIGVDLWKLG